jgi:hypothetical protein
MGVGTNIFPMDKAFHLPLPSRPHPDADHPSTPQSKISGLVRLVDPNEMAHIQAFPSVLRLLLSHQLLGFSRFSLI